MYKNKRSLCNLINVLTTQNFVLHNIYIDTVTYYYADYAAAAAPDE
jgi:hypothetical protein